MTNTVAVTNLTVNDRTVRFQEATLHLPTDVERDWRVVVHAPTMDEDAETASHVDDPEADRLLLKLDCADGVHREGPAVRQNELGHVVSPPMVLTPGEDITFVGVGALIDVK